MPKDNTPAAQAAPLPKRIRRVRTLGIVCAVLSALGLAFMAFCTFSTLTLIPMALEDPSLGGSVQIEGIDAGMLGLQGATNADLIGVILLLVSLFAAMGALISLMTFLASIGIIRSVKRPKSRARCFALGLIGGILSIASLRLISGALLIVAAVMIQREHVEQEGGAKVYYADGKRLGFMRFVQFACIAVIIMDATSLLFVTKSSNYNGAWWINFVMLLMMAVTYWIIWNRREHGCAIICAMVGVYLVINLVYYIAIGTFSAGEFAIDSFWPIVMLLYFGFSKQARYTLSRPFKLETRANQLKEQEELWNLKSPQFWRNLLLYFCIFSVVGHWMEWSVCWLIRWGIVPGTYDPNSGIWHDMLNPFFVYGAAFVVIGLLLFPIKNKLVRVFKGKVAPALFASFLVNTLFCAAIELGMGLVLNTPPDPVTGKLPLWDYSNMAFNFMGQICLLNTSFFGVMATLMTWIVYPALEKAFSKIPKDVMSIVTVVVVVFFVLVVCMYVINLNLDALTGGIVTTSQAPSA